MSATRLPLAIALLAAIGCGSDPIEDELLAEIDASQTDCGELVFDNSSSCPAVDPAEAIDCFETGPRPYIKQTIVTIEGDPIVEHFFDPGIREVVVFRDTRADAFGPQEITRSTCTSLVVSEGQIGGGCKFVTCAD